MDPWKHPPRLAGRHVVLEPLQRAHVDGLRAAANDGRLWELWFTNVPRPDEMDAHVDAALAMQAAGECLAFTVRDARGAIAGMTRCYDLAPKVPRLQIGYTWYARRVQRTGLNTEAKLLLLEHAFGVLECVSIGLQTSADNQVSRNAITRLGAKEEGVLRRHQRHRDGSLRDTVCFSITDEEWLEVRDRLRGLLERHPE